MPSGVRSDVRPTSSVAQPIDSKSWWACVIRWANDSSPRSSCSTASTNVPHFASSAAPAPSATSAFTRSSKPATSDVGRLLLGAAGVERVALEHSRELVHVVERVDEAALAGLPRVRVRIVGELLTDRVGLPDPVALGPLRDPERGEHGPAHAALPSAARTSSTRPNARRRSWTAMPAAIHVVVVVALLGLGPAVVAVGERGHLVDRARVADPERARAQRLLELVDEDRARGVRREPADALVGRPVDPIRRGARVELREREQDRVPVVVALHTDDDRVGERRRGVPRETAGDRVELRGEHVGRPASAELRDLLARVSLEDRRRAPVRGREPSPTSAPMT